MTQAVHMVTGDARALSAEVLGDLRRRVVAAVESGTAQVEAARLFGVSRQTVGVWVRDYRVRGEHAFRPGRRGRKPGEQLALTAGQQLWVARTVTGRSPDEVGLRYQVWTRQAVIELINREFLVPLGVTTAGNYLVRWGFPLPQDLLHELRSRNALAVADPDPVLTTDDDTPAWLPGAEVVWVGHGRPTWGTPTDSVDWPGTRLLQAVSNRGAMSFLSVQDPRDSAEVHDFLDRLVLQSRRRLNIIVTWTPGPAPLPTWLTHDNAAAAIRYIAG